MNAPLLTSTHWGVYEVETEAGRVTRLKPFAHDPDPSPIGDSMPAALTSPARILRPAIRKSWLEGGPGSRTEGRGAEPFVEVPWKEALDLVAAELKRVKAAHGNDAIFAGSYGWGSAGRFHHAQSQVHRFMNAIGGYVRHVTSYSLGAGRTLLPHVLRGIDELRSRHTAWASLEKHCQLFVAFGGVSAKNVQVNAGGVSQHDARPGLRSLVRAGVAFVNVSPVRQDLGEVPGAEWIPIRPNTDTAVMLALAHVLVAENLHDRAFLETHCVGFERFRLTSWAKRTGCPRRPSGRDPSPASSRSACGLWPAAWARAARSSTRAGRCSARTTASSRSGWPSRWQRCWEESARPAAAWA
jgi:biotin/methionine sulfoxide reductase